MIVIWDFNGTILDDVDICITCTNQMLTKRNIPPLTKDRYLEIFDFPIQNYYERVGFDFNKEPFQELAAEYISIYQPESYNAPLRQDVVDKIKELKEKGYIQILLSASKQCLLKEQTDAFGLSSLFDEILGLNDIYAKSKVEIALDWIDKNKFEPEKIVLIGDTTHDYEVSQKIGCRCILLCGGHNNRERLLSTGGTVLDMGGVSKSRIAELFHISSKNGHLY